METNSNDTEAQQPASAGCHPTTCSPSSDLGLHPEYLKAADRAMQMEMERNDARRDRDEWKDSCARYHAANADLLKERNDMLDLLRRISRKGEFMDREGLRLVVSDWLARRGLSLENAKHIHPEPEAKRQ